MIIVAIIMLRESSAYKWSNSSKINYRVTSSRYIITIRETRGLSRFRNFHIAFCRDLRYIYFH